VVTEPLADELGVGLAVAPVRAVARLVLGTVAGDVVLGVAMIKFLSCHKKSCCHKRKQKGNTQKFGNSKAEFSQFLLEKKGGTSSSGCSLSRTPLEHDFSLNFGQGMSVHAHLHLLMQGRKHASAPYRVFGLTNCLLAQEKEM